MSSSRAGNVARAAPGALSPNQTLPPRTPLAPAQSGPSCVTRGILRGSAVNVHHG